LSTKIKVGLIVVLTAIIIGILILPETGWLKREFHVTENPQTVYNEALAKGKPIYLEFYASW
jgi:hypothetical protein